MQLYTRRVVANRICLSLSLVAMAVGLAVLAWIVGVLVVKGIGAVRPSVFTAMTPPPGEAGGLLNAIVGSLLMVTVGTLIATPTGVLAGIYLAEYGGRGWLAPVTRFVNDILLSAPSIILGLFIYAVYVANVKHFSGWSGAFALALIAVPVIVRATDNMLALVPNSLREAAAALGAPRWKVIWLVTLRASRAGVLTGILLAVARISGETAPLLFTALNSPYWPESLGKPTANLTTTIFAFAMSPYPRWQTMAWGAALLITLAVLLITVAARTILKGKKP